MQNVPGELGEPGGSMMHRSMSRRTALRSAVGGALAAGGLTLGGTVPAAAAAAAGAPTTAAGGVFRDVRDFHGSWEGVYDGRRARLTIAVAQEPPAMLATVYFTFTDLGRDETYTGSRRNVPPGTRAIAAITLGGPALLSWPTLLIHTRDTDILSGTADPGGRRHPMVFYRSTAAPSPVPNRPFRGFEDWCGLPVGQGRYLGSLDGRGARLDVDCSYAGSERRMTFRLGDLERRIEWYTRLTESDVRRWSYDRQRNPLAGVWMKPYWERQEPLWIDSLYWHGHNAAYVTGESTRQGGPCGMSFIRRTPLPG
ncbi:hypothetical protein [Streptomyces sp. NPDC053079]|uniref:hypothetical protein n=1 Tax=Streptomyces sp. NPDC053079 TaxID=3365697 RepID=UPI0037D622FD